MTRILTSLAITCCVTYTLFDLFTYIHLPNTLVFIFSVAVGIVAPDFIRLVYVLDNESVIKRA